MHIIGFLITRIMKGVLKWQRGWNHGKKEYGIMLTVLGKEVMFARHTKVNKNVVNKPLIFLKCFSY